MNLGITKVDYGWKYIINGNVSENFCSAKNAIEAGSKKMIELLPELHDFGQGPVPAHQHKNGGGWVADTAHVNEAVYIGPDACVFGKAKVYGYVQIRDNARVFGRAQLFNNVIIRDRAKIHGTTIIEGRVNIGDDIIFSAVKISKDREITRT